VFGDKAKKVTSNLIYGNHVEVNVLDQERYDQEVRIVFQNNNINGKLIKKGLRMAVHQIL